MTGNKKTQFAGPKSKQVQAERDVHIYEAPSYTQIIEIVEATTLRIAKDMIPEAHLKASEKALLEATRS